MPDGQTRAPRGAPPLRFLLLVIGGWICVRAAFLVGDWGGEAKTEEPVLAAAPARHPPLPRTSPEVSSGTPEAPAGPVFAYRREVAVGELAPQRTPPVPDTKAAPALTVGLVRQADGEGQQPSVAASPAPTVAPLLRPTPAAASRWSGSAWAFVRRGEAAQLSAGGTLGGSQVGARILYRLTDPGTVPLSISGRVYASLEHARESEAALGIDWQPAMAIPLHILAERRQAIGHDGRTAFALLAYGGLSKAIGRLQADLYGQTGLVGVRSRDFFADGSARISARLDGLGKLRAGAGIWAATQPSVSRVDVGPGLSYQVLPHLAVAADWRWRITGNASPRSGPSLTLSTDF